MSRSRLFLIDGYSNIFRAYYAIRQLSNSKGVSTNAVYGFLQMLRKLLRDERPEYLGVALDMAGETVRSERYEEYKANRAPMPEDLRPQIPWIRQVIEAYNIPILELKKYEADDVLGTLAKKAAAKGFEVILVSADKDLMQLVDEKISLFHTGRGKLYDPELVEADFGVPPSQVVDVLALKGDSVDNIPGVPGIGEKGACQLVSEFGSVEELLDRAAEVKRKSYREGLQQHRDLAEMSKELATIHTDISMPFEAEKLRLEPPDIDLLAEVFREMEFFSLLEELQGSGNSATEQIPPATEIGSPDDWKKRVEAMSGEVVVAVIGQARLLGLAVSSEEDERLFADFRTGGLREAVIETLSNWLEDETIRLVGHDMKEVIRLCPLTTEVRATLVDPMLVSYVLQPALRTYLLEALALDRLNYSAVPEKDAGWTSAGEPPQSSEGLLTYASERTALTARLAAATEPELEKDPDLFGVYDEIEARLMPVLVSMEQKGILLDSEFLADMSNELGREIQDLEVEIFELAGDRFNLNSPRQLGSVLFEKLGYPVIRKTRKTKSYSTDSETLKELSDRGYPMPGKLLRFRELTKLKSTYVDALPTLVAEDGRIHTRFNQTVAATGRLSSVNPNLQNIPIRTKTGQQIRKAFTAPQDYVLLAADYSQIELRVLAHIAEEQAMIKAFTAGEDVHRATAAEVFEVAPELVTREQRDAAKVINFGIIYGMSAFGLARNLNLHPSEAQTFIDTYMERYPGVRRYTEETLSEAESSGKVTTLYGRVRWLPDLKSKNHNRRENARRMAINARIQGTAADLLKKAMIAVDRELRSFPEAHLLLTVHDELVLECPVQIVESVSSLVKKEMEGVAVLKVPLVAEIGSGSTWYAAKVS
jgi:DNA polymerase-1